MNIPRTLLMPQAPEQQQAASSPTPVATPADGPIECANCRKSGAELRCSLCRKKWYCSAKCQRDDWPYHKRICEKPKAAARAPSPPPQQQQPAPSETVASTTTTTPTAASGNEGEAAASVDAKPAPSPSPPPSSSGGDVELDDEDLAAIADVKKKGYRYFARKLGAEETAAIGDIRPKAVVTPTPAPLSEPSSVGAATTAIAPPAPVPAAAAISSASAWNSANTVEQRDLLPWVKLRLKELLDERRKRGDLTVVLPGIGRVAVTGVKNWGSSSSADIIIARGKSKYIYDVDFEFEVRITPEAALAAGEGDASAAVMAEDGEAAATEPAAAGSSSGDGASSSEAGTSKPAAAAAKKAAPAHAVMLLRFPDVGNDTEDEPRRVVVEWGSPAPADGQHETLRRVAAVEQKSAGFASHLREVVEQVVAEFKLK